MERLTIAELIEHCDRQMARIPSGNRFYQEHESVRAYLQILRHYIATDLTPERVAELAQAERDGQLVVLLCGLHKSVFYLEDGNWYEDVICQVTWGQQDGDHKDTVRFVCEDGFGFEAEQIGKTVFLTHQEAEAAVERRAMALIAERTGLGRITQTIGGGPYG